MINVISGSPKKIAGDTRNNWVTMMFVTHNRYRCFRKQSYIDICIEAFRQMERFGFEFGDFGFAMNHVHFLVNIPKRYSVETAEIMLKSYTAKKIFEMVSHFKDVMNQIDHEMIDNWVKDLVIVKTFIGLKFQEAILKSVAKKYQMDYRLADPAEESQGIDGFIGSTPVSIKPTSYEIKKALSETITVPIIFYEKIKNGIKISFEDWTK